MNSTLIYLRGQITLTEKLFKHVSSYDIYCALIGEEVKVGTMILSPIRKDNRPTFQLFIPEDKDEVFFKDWAWRGGNVFTFVKYYALYQEGVTLSTRYWIIKYIDEAMGIGIFDSTVKRHINKKVIDESFYVSRRILKFCSRPYTKRDLQYWKQYHIEEDTLIKYDVRSVHKTLNDNNEVVYTTRVNELAFAFVMYGKLKLYRPEADAAYKWRNNCPGGILQGLAQIIGSKKKKLIITKSLKDIMVFDVFIGHEYDVIAPHSETYNFSEKLLQKLYAKYSVIFIIFDFDLAGVTGANKLYKRNKEKFKVTFVSTRRVLVNNKIKVIDKDISDYSVGRKEIDVKKHLLEIGL